jgi:hypothetical protein
VLSPLPRVTKQTRRQLLKEIDEKGPFEFTRAAVAELEQSNPEPLQAVHHFASGLGNYLQAMQRIRAAAPGPHRSVAPREGQAALSPPSTGLALIQVQSGGHF